MKSAPHISWLLLTKPKQGMISMGYCKKDVTPLLTHWSTSLLHQVIHIKSVICGLPPPLITSSFNALKSIWQCLKFSLSLVNVLSIKHHIIVYRDISIVLYCDCQIRDIHNQFQYLHWLLKSGWRCPVTQRCSLDMSLILCYSNVSTPGSDYLKMVGMDKYATLKM